MNKKDELKVLWLSHRDPMNPKAGGVERTILEICSRLVKPQLEITVIASRWKNSNNIQYINGFRVVRFGTNVSLHLFVPFFIFKNKPDIIIADLGHVVPWPSTSIMRKKTVIFFHHLHRRTLHGQINRVLAYFLTAIEKCYLIMYSHNKFVTESDTSIGDLLTLGIDRTNIVQIIPGIDQNVFKRRNKTPEPSIVYFGGMRKYKRPEEVIHVFHDLIGKVLNLKLIMIGSGSELQSLKNLADKYELSNSITFTGRVSDEFLAERVSEAWLNLHTSVAEGWGFSITEASASGTPTVAYSVPGVRDSIEDGKNGLTVKDGDRNALSEAAMKILSSPESWWDSSAEVAKKYSWGKSAERWNEILQGVNKEKKSGRA